MSSNTRIIWGSCLSKIAYLVPVRLYQDVPEPLYGIVQDSPSKAIFWICRDDMDRCPIAQIIVEWIFCMGKSHVATSFDLEVAIPVPTISHFSHGTALRHVVVDPSLLPGRVDGVAYR